MKIQIDTSRKIIILEEAVGLDELFQLVKKLFPDDWKQYKLEIKQIVNWTTPTIIEKHKGWWDDPYRPTWTSPQPRLDDITCYNLELKD